MIAESQHGASCSGWKPHQAWFRLFHIRVPFAMLAAKSEYFDCLLFGSMKEARSDEITLEDTPLEAFHVLLNYMYSGSVKILDMQVRVCYDHLLYTTQMMGIETTIDQEIFTLKIIRVKNFVFINFRGLFNSRNFFNSWVT